MTVTEISIRPVGGGWMVSVDGVENVLAFRRGSDAEASARRLAVRLGEAGCPVRIQLHLSPDTPAAQLVYATSRAGPELAWITSGGDQRAA